MAVLIKNGIIVSEGLSFKGSLLIIDDTIESVIKDSSDASYRAKIEEIESNCSNRYGAEFRVIDATDLYLLPGVIDTHVHFREPGDASKGTIESESKAAVLGGVTSYFDMPNNSPAATTIALLEKKYQIAKENSWANYSFYLGATSDNIQEITNLDSNNNCGVKLFMGSSTGSLCVDNVSALERIFSESKLPIAVHAEDNAEISKNLSHYKEQFGDDIPASLHHLIRSREACIKATKTAISMAEKYNSRLHILHISTLEEVELLRAVSTQNKRITAETCAHYLWFSDDDYNRYQNLIKCNPAIKTRADRDALRQAVAEGIIPIVSTDHAPHKFDDKKRIYTDAPSGIPLVQYSLLMSLQMYKSGLFSLERVVDYLSEAPARLFGIERRGVIKEGYYADIVLVDMNGHTPVSKETIASKCGWSPFMIDDFSFDSSIEYLLVNGCIVVAHGKLTGDKCSRRLKFKHL